MSMNPLLRYPADIGPIPGKSIRQIEQEKAASEPVKSAQVIVNIKPGLRTVNGKMETVGHMPPNETVK